MQMNNTVAVIFSKMQILVGFQSTMAPLTEGGFPVGLCDWSVSVMSLQWLSKFNLGRLPFVASAADSRNKSKQIWSAAVKHIFQHKERKKTKQNKKLQAVLNRKLNDECPFCTFSTSGPIS